MYYEEKQENGLWYWRGSPKYPWHRFTPEQYIKKCNELHAELKKLKEEAIDLGIERSFND